MQIEARGRLRAALKKRRLCRFREWFRAGFAVRFRGFCGGFTGFAGFVSRGFAGFRGSYFTVDTGYPLPYRSVTVICDCVDTVCAVRRPQCGAAALPAAPPTRVWCPVLLVCGLCSSALGSLTRKFYRLLSVSVNVMLGQTYTKY